MQRLVESAEVPFCAPRRRCFVSVRYACSVADFASNGDRGGGGVWLLVGVFGEDPVGFGARVVEHFSGGHFPAAVGEGVVAVVADAGA
jgi:hypothetical protein